MIRMQELKISFYVTLETIEHGSSFFYAIVYKALQVVVHFRMKCEFLVVFGKWPGHVPMNDKPENMTVNLTLEKSSD